MPQLTGNSNPGFHGISQVFYEYTSAFANNGSGFEGLGDATVLVEPHRALGAGAGPLSGADHAAGDRRDAGAQARKRRKAPAACTSKPRPSRSPLIAVIVILTLLQFMPALVLGPVADHLSLVACVRKTP
jgi:K+-transporting ATPase ATPase A chain